MAEILLDCQRLIRVFLHCFPVPVRVVPNFSSSFLLPDLGSAALSIRLPDLQPPSPPLSPMSDLFQLLQRPLPPSPPQTSRQWVYREVKWVQKRQEVIVRQVVFNPDQHTAHRNEHIVTIY